MLAEDANQSTLFSKHQNTNDYQRVINKKVAIIKIEKEKAINLYMIIGSQLTTSLQHVKTTLKVPTAQLSPGKLHLAN